MVSDILEQRIYELVRSHDGIYLFKKKELTPSTDLDSDLRLEDDEALALMDDFFTTFNVDKGNFSISSGAGFHDRYAHFVCQVWSLVV